MTTAPKPFVFVLMPFSKEFDDLYNLGIRPACEEAGAYCERVDEQVYEGKIIDRVYNQIATAKFIVAVMTGRNANVFYEVGYAHALNKQVILLVDDAKAIPFDLSSFPHIVYPSITQLKQGLSVRLRSLIAQPETESTYFNVPLKFLYDGKPLEKVSELLLIHDNIQFLDYTRRFRLSIDIQNSTEKMIAKRAFRLGFVCSLELKNILFYDSRWNRASLISSSRLEDGRMFYLANRDFSLLPGGFEKLNIEFYREENFNSGAKVEITIRILTEAGMFDQNLNFTLK